MKTAILINDTSNEHHIGCDTVIYNIKRLCEINGIKVIKTFTRRDVHNHKCQNELGDCDIIIINGEGSLHDAYGRNFLQPLLNMIPFGKKVALINSLWYKMGHIDGIEKLALISFRETRSYSEFMKDYELQPLLHTPILITPDVIFWREKKNLHIGYGDSVYGNVSSKLNIYGNYFPLDYRKNFSFIPPKQDLKRDNVEDYIQWLKSLDLYITGRFHGVCLSAMAGTPVLALPSNAEKIEALMSDMGCKDLIINNEKEMEWKKTLAYKYVPNIQFYALDAHYKVERLFTRIKEIAYGKP